MNENVFEMVCKNRHSMHESNVLYDTCDGKIAIPPWTILLFVSSCTCILMSLRCAIPLEQNVGNTS